jgi:lysophospholipase L1-like esterase
MTYRSRRSAALGSLAALTLALGAAVPALAQHPGKTGPPNSIASTGDSITRGFHTQSLLTDTPANSWSTGTNAAVNSHYNRILAINPAISGHTFNEGLTGAKMNDFARQAANAAARNPEYVTVLLGANDACTSTEAGMTTAATFRAQFRAGMENLAVGAPDARVYVVSVPNIYRLWEIGRTNFTATLQWSLFGICQSMLASPTSTTAANQQRRERVRAHVQLLNQQLREVCAEYIHCRYDNDAAFNTNFVSSDMSSLDFFHPNVTGQAKAAAVTWAQTFDFADRTAPTTGIALSSDVPEGVDGWYRDDVRVALTAADADLRGTEYYYRLDGAEDSDRWLRYGDPFTVDAEGITRVTYRSVDVNGNIEEAKTSEVKIDRTPPTIALTCPSPALLRGGAQLAISADDALSGLADDPTGTYDLDTSLVGTHTQRSEVQDRAGNVASATCDFAVHYAFGGVEQPVNGDGTSVFKANSTVPVKFALADAAEAPVTDAIADLKIVHIDGVTSGALEDAVSTAASTDGTRFRFNGSHYQFNLSTKGLSIGTKEARISLDDGTVRTVRFRLR